MNRLPRINSVVYLFLGATIILPAFVTADTETAPPAGVLWEVTSQMSMAGMGMKMPAQKVKACAPVEWTEPPGAGNEERGCINSGMERTLDTVTWTSVCEGPPAMTGGGEITFNGSEAYSGAIQYETDQGNVAILLNGIVIGACDNPR